MANQTFTEIIRFAFSGGVALIVQLGLLHVFSSVFGFWYLFSAIIAHIISIIINFIFQKFYVRKNYSVDAIRVQALSFAVLAGAYLIINAALLYVLVSFFLWPYLIAQGLLVVLLSAITFMVNKYFIFKSN